MLPNAAALPSPGAPISPSNRIRQGRHPSPGREYRQQQQAGKAAKQTSPLTDIHLSPGRTLAAEERRARVLKLLRDHVDSPSASLDAAVWNTMGPAKTLDDPLTSEPGESLDAHANQHSWFSPIMTVMLSTRSSPSPSPPKQLQKKAQASEKAQATAPESASIEHAQVTRPASRGKEENGASSPKPWWERSLECIPFLAAPRNDLAMIGAAGMATSQAHADLDPRAAAAGRLAAEREHHMQKQRDLTREQQPLSDDGTGSRQLNLSYGDGDSRATRSTRSNLTTINSCRTPSDIPSTPKSCTSAMESSIGAFSGLTPPKAGAFAPAAHMPSSGREKQKPLDETPPELDEHEHKDESAPSLRAVILREPVTPPTTSLMPSSKPLTSAKPLSSAKKNEPGFMTPKTYRVKHLERGSVLMPDGRSPARSERNMLMQNRASTDAHDLWCGVEVIHDHYLSAMGFPPLGQLQDTACMEAQILTDRQRRAEIDRLASMRRQRTMHAGGGRGGGGDAVITSPARQKARARRMKS
jgi:hypothetical protein